MYEDDYRNLLLHVQTHGAKTVVRNGYTMRLLNQVLTADLREGMADLGPPASRRLIMPMLTGRRLPWDGIKGELLAFLKGTSKLEDFIKLGCNFWTANQKDAMERGIVEEGDLGPIYGVQWRRFKAANDDILIDQLQRLVDGLKAYQASLDAGLPEVPNSRRHLVTAWHPDELEDMCLPPCHFAFQCHTEALYAYNDADGPYIEGYKLHTTVFMRSADMVLGVPCDMASYALLTHLLALLVNMVPGTVTLIMSDCHIYGQHLEPVGTYNMLEHVSYVDQYLDQPTTELPSLFITPYVAESVRGKASLNAITSYLQPEDFWLTGYEPSSNLKIPMVV
jgi:thymidylate synthase